MISRSDIPTRRGLPVGSYHLRRRSPSKGRTRIGRTVFQDGVAEAVGGRELRTLLWSQGHKLEVVPADRETAEAVVAYARARGKDDLANLLGAVLDAGEGKREPWEPVPDQVLVDLLEAMELYDPHGYAVSTPEGVVVYHDAGDNTDLLERMLGTETPVDVTLAALEVPMEEVEGAIAVARSGEAIAMSDPPSSLPGESLPEAPHGEAVTEQTAPSLADHLGTLGLRDLRRVASAADIQGRGTMLKGDLVAALADLGREALAAAMTEAEVELGGTE